jgi:hypothetical protein
MLARINLRRALTIAGIAVLVIFYVLLWLQMITSPAERSASDFIAFYSAGRIADTQGLGRVYDLDAQTKAEDRVLQETIREAYAARGLPPPADLGAPLRPSDIAPFPHPPFILPLLQLVALLDYVPAFIAWTCILLAFFVLDAALLVRLLPQARGPQRRVLFLGTLLFFPSFFNLVNGQDAAILLLGGSLWALALLQGRDRLSGLGLALTTIRPQMALVLAVPFLFKRRRIWWAFCAGAAVLVLFSLLLIGRTGTVNYLHILSIYAGGEGFRIFENLMVNLVGLLHRLFPALAATLIRAAGWTGYGLALVGLGIVSAKSAAITEKHLGLAVVLALLAVPHAHYNELVLLLILLYGVMRTLVARDLVEVENAVLFPLGLALVYFFSALAPVLKYSLSYLVMVLMLLVLWFPEKMVFWKRGKPAGLESLPRIEDGRD